MPEGKLGGGSPFCSHPEAPFQAIPPRQGTHHQSPDHAAAEQGWRVDLAHECAEEPLVWLHGVTLSQAEAAAEIGPRGLWAEGWRARGWLRGRDTPRSSSAHPHALQPARPSVCGYRGTSTPQRVTSGAGRRRRLPGLRRGQKSGPQAWGSGPLESQRKGYNGRDHMWGSGQMRRPQCSGHLVLPSYLQRNEHEPGQTLGDRRAWDVFGVAKNWTQLSS